MPMQIYTLINLHKKYMHVIHSTMSSPTSSFAPTQNSKKIEPSDLPKDHQKLPIREIPGDYGLPFFGAIKDRYDYFYNQGQDQFFKTRIQKYNSTVFKTNMPPGPFLAPNPKVIAVLDSISFPILFDNSKVEKKDVLDGTYMPSTSLFGFYRPCAFLDPSENSHYLLKSFFLSQLAKLHTKFIKIFHWSVDNLFFQLENEVSKNGKADFNALSDEAAFDFVFRLFSNDSSKKVEEKMNIGPKSFDKWLAIQLAPLMSLKIKMLPNWIEDLVLHTFPLPSFLVKSEYQKLYDAFWSSASDFLDAAEKVGIKRDEACHNLVFLAGFNAYGGMKVLFPALMKWVGLAGKDLHDRLTAEIRSVVKGEGGVLTHSAIEKMSLTKSVAYEALRIEPPVPFQYGKAKEDIMINSHESSYLIKKGEMIFGYQPFATKDPKIFTHAEEFVGDRFVGEGEKLIKYVYWSNGRETENPAAGNKQCPAKDLVVLLNRLLLAEFFLKYDTFTVEASTILLGPAVTFTSLTKAEHS